MINRPRVLNWLASQFTDLFLSVVGGVINDPATPAHQPGRAVCWLPLGLMQVWRRAFLLRDLGGAGVSRLMEPKSRLPARGRSVPGLSPALCYSMPSLSWGTCRVLAELCHLQIGLHHGVLVFLWNFIHRALSQ